jgi:exosome complex RNA-binding protein Rrp42 (RNase PH superfamily)
MLALERIVWVIYIDLVCLDHSGNMDASVSVLISALKTVTLPSVTMDTDTREVVVSDKKTS